ncbi:60 kDa lysophospholipase [Gadus morhua]|uniref:60 kDa lysophospholipase n=1 Tax=Gadus morhua TaxID=8049 RepID=UPI0011B57F94|nr:60 kDa lysophospholipase-like [Gadus morhua]
MTALSQALSNPKPIMRNCTIHGSRNEVSVLVINTGGTIGMKSHGDVLEPEDNVFVEGLRKLTTFHDERYAEETCMYDFYGNRDKTLVLPAYKDNKRVVYTFLEYSPLLDSSNMTTEDWAKIGKDIEKNYEGYDGFVILHGTDTMAYTASALSFMCDHLGKPVILTGSQVPIYEIRSDGRDNLQGALLLAGLFHIPEVCLYFRNKLYRGNRVTKVDAGSFDAFTSPNLSPLANLDVDITINWDTVWRANRSNKFAVNTGLNRNVGLLRLFPGITAATVRSFLQLPMEGVVLETYGTGNAPDNRPDLLAEMKEATDRGVIIINTTQCLRGTVSKVYATGEVLYKAGLLPGVDMTPEAVLSKLSYVLAIEGLDLQTKKKMMAENLRGEMMADLAGAKLNLRDSRFIQVIAKSLSISCREELVAIRDALTPPLACAAAKIGDVEALKSIQEMGSNLSVGDYDGRTPLHIAASEGHLKVVQYLLDQGSTIHSQDRYGDTPLSNAVRFRRKDIVMVLRKGGAHLSREQLAVSGTELCSLAANGDLDGLQIWHLAGADLTTPGYDGKTALSVATGAGKLEAVALINLLLSARDQDK